jgi:SSS family solute:Na+ symporter
MAALSVSYVALGGFEADIRTDIVEFFFMFGGFAVIVPWCVATYGGPEFLAASLPPLHLTWHGGNTVQYILGWFVIALWTFVDPGFHQRCYAAADGRTARRGILVSICLWALFDFLTLTAGLYARAAIPDLPSPTMAYPMLADRVLPPVALGFFYAGMLATIMSTVNTTTFISGQTLGRDLFLRVLLRFQKGLGPGTGPGDTRHEPVDGKILYTRVGVLVAAAAAVPIAWAMQSVIEIWYTAGTIALPGLLAGVLSAWSRRFRMTRGFAVAAMTAGSGTSALWWLGRGWFPDAMGSVEPVYPGLVVALCLWGISLAGGTPPHAEASGRLSDRSTTGSTTD